MIPLVARNHLEENIPQITNLLLIKLPWWILKKKLSNRKFKRPGSHSAEAIRQGRTYAESRGLAIAWYANLIALPFLPPFDGETNVALAVTRFRSATWPVYCRVTTFILSPCHACSRDARPAQARTLKLVENVYWPLVRSWTLFRGTRGNLRSRSTFGRPDAISRSILRFQAAFMSWEQMGVVGIQYSTTLWKLLRYLGGCRLKNLTVFYIYQ